MSKKSDAVLDAADTAKDTKKASQIAGGGRGGNSTGALNQGKSDGFEAWLNKGNTDNKVYYGVDKNKKMYILV